MAVIFIMNGSLSNSTELGKRSKTIKNKSRVVALSKVDCDDKSLGSQAVALQGKLKDTFMFLQSTIFHSPVFGRCVICQLLCLHLVLQHPNGQVVMWLNIQNKPQFLLVKWPQRDIHFLIFIPLPNSRIY